MKEKRVIVSREERVEKKRVQSKGNEACDNCGYEICKLVKLNRDSILVEGQPFKGPELYSSGSIVVISVV